MNCWPAPKGSPRAADCPDGGCRELINVVHNDNHLREVLMEDGSVTTISALLPYRL